MFVRMDCVLESPVDLGSSFGWWVGWLVGFGFPETEPHYVALAILEGTRLRPFCLCLSKC